ncbi:hypothetical protein BU16DRAFT_458795 [Lophium mytilinum]|uniref:Integral membrane protein n=1 Tax=Lophium mytilinum TaxID=390894 RepID=A0A6A6QY50_9PEZI|nr:hypothetical protein BU16DRAFT_458795 [Lophium mytilinum]
MITNESEIYIRILDPPPNIPAEHSSNYYMLRKCSYPTDIAYPAFWFRTSFVPDFNVCTYCFETHIRNSQFSEMFEGTLQPAFPSTRCNFGVPTVLRMMWSLALKTNNFASLKAYMERRVSLPRCYGSHGVVGSTAGPEGIKWYSPRNDQALGFVACEACYEEQVKGTSFALNFERCPRAQGPNDTWACDLSFSYMLRAINLYSMANMWPSFITSATRRVTLPECVGLSSVKTGTRSWYTTAKPIKGAIVCEACYLDHAGLTDFEREFVSYPVDDTNRNQACNCDLWPLPLKVSMEVARDTYNFSIFWDTFNVFSNNPPCTNEGITDGTWYTLKGGCQNFDLCITCYTGWVRALKLTQHFEPRAPAPPGTNLMCDFNAASPRFAKYINKYAEAISTPNFAAFSNYVHRVADLPICQTTDFVANRRWWILQNLDPRKTVHVCESCYEDAIRGTALAHILEHTPTPLPQGIMCEMYSANMRKRWITLSNSKTPDIEAFVEYCQHRNAVYTQTVPAMKAIIAQAKLRLQQQTILNATSSFYNSANAISAASAQIHYGPGGTTGGHLYGNGALGYHWETPCGVQGAVAGQQAMGLVAQGMGDTARVGVLERMWKEVE